MFSQVARKVVNVNLGLKVHLSFNFSFGRACITPKVLSQYGTKLTGKIPEKKNPFCIALKLDLIFTLTSG